MRNLFLLLSFVLLSICTAGQQSAESSGTTDSLTAQSQLRGKLGTRWHMKPHSPFKATVLAVALPGAGQIYNGIAREGSVIRKFWKVPVVWAALGTCVYYIDFNTKQYNLFRQQYVAAADGDPATIPTLSDNALYLNAGMDYYRRFMDISYMSLAGVYILQAIDANVDAHLFYYDISDDLSLRWHPSYFIAGSRNHGLGLTLEF
jgi:hypothetical protein